MATDYPNLTIQIGERKFELLPCPFCGGTKLEITNPIGAGSFANVTCLDCYATGGLGITKQDAINKWDTRTPKERGGEK